jgi:hypothetical protein
MTLLITHFSATSSYFVPLWGECLYKHPVLVMLIPQITKRKIAVSYILVPVFSANEKSNDAVPNYRRNSRNCI